MAAAGSGARQIVSVGGRRVTLTHLDKVMYPSVGWTKADVLDYFSRVASALIPLVADRPVTRKRWVHGVGTEAEPAAMFFAKNLEQGAPDWIARRDIEHSSHANAYPLVNDLATLTWLAQMATLEIHAPQWRFGTDGDDRNPDRMVLDLDPGDGAGLAECAEVARLARAILTDIGLDPLPVTSGSKGIHLYSPLDGTRSSEDIAAIAHELARALEADHSDLVVSDMKKTLRAGKVLVDWSQNNAAKTTLVPYSLRGTLRPMAAAPRTWSELDDASLRQLEPGEVLERLEQHGDLLAPLHADAADAAEATSDQTQAAEADRLTRYRGMRDAAKTPEPVPEARPTAAGDTSFVIQEHHATRLHWDFRLERDGVLVSWALPRGVPALGGKNHLAVHTEDHPLEYGSFEGEIPAGEYGGGTVTIWDSGTYTAEKWRDSEVIATLQGRHGGGLAGEPVRVALIRTGRGRRGAEQAPDDPSGEQWLMHRMALPGGETAAHAHASTKRHGSATPTQKADASPPPAAVPKPMLATVAPRTGLDRADEWSLEMKWDGIRAIAVVEAGEVRLISRNDLDLTPTFPELEALADELGAGRAVFDGEIVAPDARGRPSFSRLQQRMGLTKPADVARAQRQTAVRFLLFDVLFGEGDDQTGMPYRERRALLERLIRPGALIDVPPVVAEASGDDIEAALADAMSTSERLGLEGVVAKRSDSPYRAGRRASDWRKVKHERAQEVVVGGWRPGNGRRADGIGSLLLGVQAADGLRYVGRVGTGFSDDDLDSVLARLHPLTRSTTPFTDIPAADARDAHWVTPSQVGEVRFAEWTDSGRLRQPSWRGWRPDKPAAEVVREG